MNITQKNKTTTSETETNPQYDFENYSNLANLVHDHLKTAKYFTYYQLSFHWDNLKYYHSKTECDRMRKKCLKAAYKEAESYFTVKSPKCIANETAKYYSEYIKDCFSASIMDMLKIICTKLNLESTFERIQLLIHLSHSNLWNDSKNELIISHDYYKLSEYDKFLEQAEIISKIHHNFDGAISRFFEGLIESKCVQYQSIVTKSIAELQKEVNSHAALFFQTALGDYEDYACLIGEEFEIIGRKLPTCNKGESLKNYLSRMVALLSSNH